MRLAVFTNQFPSRVSTFFARDMRGLLEAGFEIDIFPVAPLEAHLWPYVPDILNERILPRDRVHHLSLLRAVFPRTPRPLRHGAAFLRETARICASAAGYGVMPLAKSAYVMPKAWTWAQRHGGSPDHVLAYWGNYAGTCAYLFHRIVARRIPFSMYLHAGVDLYRDQVYLRQKLLYADRIILVCDFNREFLRQRYPDIFPALADKVYVHRLPLNLAEFPYEPEGHPPRTLLGVGRLDRRKGFDVLLRAAKELCARGLSVDVELVGDGEERQALTSLAAALGIAEHVAFRGWLPFEQVRAAMRRATILVHPSTGLGDAVPTVITEAMAVGTPVVASSIAGIPELLDGGRCGVLVPPRDVERLTDAVAALLANEGLRWEFAAAGRRHVERHFDLRRNGRELADVLRTARRGGGRHGASDAVGRAQTSGA